MAYIVRYNWQKKWYLIGGKMKKNEALGTARNLLKGQEIDKIIIEKTES